MRVPHGLLHMLAAVVWMIGAAVLLTKGVELLRLAAERPVVAWSPWAAGFAGAGVGVAKGRLLFAPFNRRNLARIDRLDEPRLWQFFTPSFFLALALMIAAGVVLGRLAPGNTASLLGVGALDLAIGGALASSLDVYWRKWRQG